MLTAVLLGPLVERASMTLEDPWELELLPSLEQRIPILETPWSEPACWEDPAELAEVEDASMSLVLEVLGLVLEEL